MNIKPFITIAILPAAAALAGFSDTPTKQPEAGPVMHTPDWQSTYSVSPQGGFVVGDQSAPIKIVEYASYTCGHCARFEAEDAPKLKADFIADGRASFELRNMILNGIDLTVAVLARCGGRANFFKHHSHWMNTQSAWIAGANRITPDTQDKAGKNDIVGFMTGVYTDMRLAPHVAKLGIDDAKARQCLSNPQLISPVLQMSNQASEKYKITGTPSFLVNDKLVEAHSYATLKPILMQK